MSIDSIVKESIEKCRIKLLDTSKRNNLIAFRHTERSRQHIRVIDESPDFLYGEFIDGKTLTFRSLPEDNKIPLDEKTEVFRQKLELAKLTDIEYQEASRKADGDQENVIDKLYQIERRLRDKIRADLHLPVWEDSKHLTNCDIAKKHGINPSYEIQVSAFDTFQKEGRHTDHYIQTLLKSEEMERKLSGLTSCIRSDIEETGVNTLYVAFGFLQWYESEHSDEGRMAPLLLVQLEIERKLTQSGYTYHVQATGEEPQINLSLSEKLRQEFGIVLPEFGCEDGPENYLKKINDCIQSTNIRRKDRWCVKRLITIGRFHFARLVMYHDLDEKQWPNGTGLSSNKIIQDLFTGSEDTGDAIHAEDYNVDTQEIEKIVPLLITSADASQHSAIVDVMKGKNLAIKGPPGTGKSQTITNIVACALASGKTVLFLAEKMAALNVVYNRLKQAGLESYCLELHSTKTKKLTALKSIEKRLKLKNQESISDLGSKTEDLMRYRNQITKYIDILNLKYGKQQKTVYECLWKTQLKKEQLGDFISILRGINYSLEEADLTHKEFLQHLDDLRHIVDLKTELSHDSENDKHVWSFVNNFALDLLQQNDLRHMVDVWRKTLEKLISQLEVLSKRFKITLNSSTDIATFLQKTEALNELAPFFDEKLVAKINRDNAQTLLHFYDEMKRYHVLEQSITTLKDVWASTNQIDLIESLVSTSRTYSAQNLTADEITQHGQKLATEQDLWRKNLQKIVSIARHFELSENINLEKIILLVDLPEFVASISREHLLLRTPSIMEEKNSAILKEIVNAKNSACSAIEELEKQYDLMMLTEKSSDEIIGFARAMKNAHIFSFLLDGSYREVRKFYRTLFKVGSHPPFFIRTKEAAEVFKKIASVKKERKKIEQDETVESICGNFFRGFETDFDKILHVNEWAVKVRKRYPAINSFSQKIRQWLLESDIELIDSVRNLTDDRDFCTLRNILINKDERDSACMNIEEYLSSLKEYLEKLEYLNINLKELASNSQVTFSSIQNDLPNLRKAKEIKNRVENNDIIMLLLGDCYEVMSTDISSIQPIAEFIRNCLNFGEISGIIESCLNNRFAENWEEFTQLCQSLKNELDNVEKSAFEFFNKDFGIDGTALVKNDAWQEASLRNLYSLLAKASGKPDSLSQWITFNGCIKKAEEDLKGQLLSMYVNHNLDFSTLPLAFEYLVFSTISRSIYLKHPLIAQTNGSSLERAKEYIKTLDREIMASQKKGLQNTLNKNKPLPGMGKGKRSAWTESALLSNEINKQKCHISIRELMKRASLSIQKIKPCFLMSPLTVAQYLEPGKFNFDLVVIDEASQMRSEDALGSLARAKQLVVVGDQQQLPPTSFFRLQGQDEENGEGDEDPTLESIMDMALSSFRPSRMLNRHYRSQHESLIAFSNSEFYGNSLMIFPSPIKNSAELGVRCHYVKGLYTKQINLVEAQKVVQEARFFMDQFPDRSLGIATMNQKQKDLIESEMDQAFINYPHVKQYKQSWDGTLEPFFVKNLENVQGDERDAIFISTVYGPDERGNVMQRFGPINQENGYRRLNVLFTRAKKNMVLFTSLKPEDIKVSDPNIQKGLHAFRGFLDYALNGKAAAGRLTSHEPDSDFEVVVKERLERIGYCVDPQVGVAGYRVDLGVKHPKYPYRYLLGIECDGATYHSSKSARERDIIREEVLKGLGWKIYRIWSTDWFTNLDREFEKLSNYIRELLDQGNLPKSEAINFPINTDFEEKEKAIEPTDVEEILSVEPISPTDSSEVVEILDRVTYHLIKASGQKETKKVQIVHEPGDPKKGTINEHSAIGRALLGANKNDEIECPLPTGEVILVVTDIIKNSPNLP